MDTILYLMGVKFHEIDMRKIESQPVSWLFNIWQHMNTERIAVMDRHQETVIQ